jgi:hypothetical protein
VSVDRSINTLGGRRESAMIDKKFKRRKGSERKIKASRFERSDTLV